MTQRGIFPPVEVLGPAAIDDFICAISVALHPSPNLGLSHLMHLFVGLRALDPTGSGLAVFSSAVVSAGSVLEPSQVAERCAPQEVWRGATPDGALPERLLTDLLYTAFEGSIAVVEDVDFAVVPVVGGRDE